MAECTSATEALQLLLHDVAVRGGSLNPAVTIEETHAGDVGIQRRVVATARVQASNVVLSVPCSMLLTPSAALRVICCHHSTAVSSKLSCGLSAAGLIAAAIASTRGCSGCHACRPFRSYVALLPTVQSLLHAGDGLVVRLVSEELHGTPLRVSLATARERLEHDAAHVADLCGLSLADVMWGHSQFISRAMRVPREAAEADVSCWPVGAASLTSDAAPPSKRPRFGASFGRAAATDSFVPAMVPLADFANHRPGALSEFKVSRAAAAAADAAAAAVVVGAEGKTAASGASGVAFVAGLESTAAGRSHTSLLQLVLGTTVAGSQDKPAEVLISYGAKGNGELASHYGFTLPNNAMDALPVRLTPHLVHMAATSGAGAAASSAAFDDAGVVNATTTAATRSPAPTVGSAAWIDALLGDLVVAEDESVYSNLLSADGQRSAADALPKGSAASEPAGGIAGAGIGQRPAPAPSSTTDGVSVTAPIRFLIRCCQLCLPLLDHAAALVEEALEAASPDSAPAGASTAIGDPVERFGDFLSAEDPDLADFKHRHMGPAPAVTMPPGEGSAATTVAELVLCWYRRQLQALERVVEGGPRAAPAGHPSAGLAPHLRMLVKGYRAGLVRVLAEQRACCS